MVPLWLSLLLGAALASEDTEGLDRVGLLVRDAQWERARAALDEVPVGSSGDPARHHALHGTILAALEDWTGAARAFRAAVDASDPEHVDPVLILQLAQALALGGEPDEALDVLAAAPEAARGLSAWWLLSASAAHAAGRPAEAFAALEGGAARFPDAVDFPRRQVLLLVELGLYREASERGVALLDRADVRPDDVVAIGEALRRGGARSEAEVALTQGMLRFPEALDLRVASAGLAHEAGRHRDAARQLSVVAAVDPDYADETAELYRKAGDLDAALRWNGAVPDPVEKARQRLGLLLEDGRWDHVLALEERLVRLDLHADSAVAYGLAYARFRTGDLDAAEAHLRRITDPQVFALANELRAATTACREDPWSCP